MTAHRFNISMNEMPRVEGVNSLEHLVSNLKHSLQTKFPIAFIEEVLERGSEQIHDHDIVIVLCSKMINTTEAMTASNLSIDFVFMTELRATRTVFFEFDSDLCGWRQRRGEIREMEGEKETKSVLKPFHQMDQHLNKFHQNFHHQYDE
jgi:hypothetical protein